MPEHYGEEKSEKKQKKSPPMKKGGMSEKQKKDLAKHMMKVGENMSASEKKSHRMKMMSRMRNKGMSVAAAHKDIE